METVNNKVIVWGMDNFNTLGLMRQIGAGENDLFFLVKGCADVAAKSKYCKQYKETGSVEEGYQYLLENFKAEKCKPIIIVSGDDTITFIDQHKDELKKYFIIPGTTQKGNTEKYIDKGTMIALAEELGILCPQSRKVKWDSDLDNTQYPCLLKPSHEKPGHYNEFKFKICKNKKALKRTMRLVRHDSEFVLQQFIPKKEELLVYGGRMWDGKTVLAGAFIKDRLSESGAGSHGRIVEEIPACVDVSKIAEFLERIDYYGLFSFEYGLHEGKAYFFEVNLRNDGTAHYFYQAGANIPLAYVYSAAGLDYSHISTTTTGRKWFIDEIFDIENVITGKISSKQWKKDMAEATLFRFYDEGDPLPYETVKKGRHKQILKEIVLKRFRLYIVFILDKLGLRK